MMHQYVLYGLGVHSEISLLGQEEVECPRDVNIWWRSGGLTRLGDGEERLWELLPDGEILLAWPGITTMSIRNGNEIVIETPGNGEPNHVRHLIAGLGMGLILYQRGLFTLHAAALAIGGSAIGIAGPKRSGKSTTAAFLSSLGHQLLSDDVLAVDMSDQESLQVLPGAHTVNLWPDSVIAVGRDPDSLPKIWSEGTKRISPPSGAPARNAYPLSSIFFLDPSDVESPSVERLSPSEAIPMLIGNSHVFRLVEDREAMPQHLSQCADLANRVPLFRLKRPMSLDSIQAVVSLIEDQVARPQGSATVMEMK